MVKEEREGPDGRGLILLAEDNPLNVEAIRGYLEMKGYRVEVAGDGEEALRMLQEHKPEVVLMDIQMPGMDGLEATRSIRRLEEEGLRKTPVVAMTALAMPGDRERCLQAGCDDYLSKPLKLADLLSKIAEIRGTAPR